MTFRKIAIIGLGLIGSSIGHAARRGGQADAVVGYDIDPDVRARSAKLGFATAIAGTMAEAVADADLVILCTPVGALKAAAAQAAPHLKPGAILSDVGSVKSTAIRDIAPSIPAGVHFVPAHPIAGTEFSGPEAGFASLFDGRWCIVTPLPGGDAGAAARLKAFWNGLGAQVDEMDAAHHDTVLAITSHLPHLIAYNIVRTASDLETVREAEVIKYSASGFRDFTRIAASDPTMWRDIFLNNREAVLEVLALFNRDLAQLETLVREGKGEALFDFFTRTRAIRKAIVEMGQDSAAPNFGRNTP
jgi:cyclohexadieny/prephenate dehydrogenase